MLHISKEIHIILFDNIERIFFHDKLYSKDFIIRKYDVAYCIFNHRNRIKLKVFEMNHRL